MESQTLSMGIGLLATLLSGPQVLTDHEVTILLLAKGSAVFVVRSMLADSCFIELGGVSSSELEQEFTQPGSVSFPFFDFPTRNEISFKPLPRRIQLLLIKNRIFFKNPVICTF